VKRGVGGWVGGGGWGGDNKYPTADETAKSYSALPRPAGGGNCAGCGMSCSRSGKRLKGKAGGRERLEGENPPLLKHVAIVRRSDSASPSVEARGSKRLLWRGGAAAAAAGSSLVLRIGSPPTSRLIGRQRRGHLDSLGAETKVHTAGCVPHNTGHTSHSTPQSQLRPPCAPRVGHWLPPLPLSTATSACNRCPACSLPSVNTPS